MARPSQRFIVSTVATLLWGVASSPALSQSSNCDGQIAIIANKIRNNGVTDFELFAVDRAAKTSAKIVGSCDGGRQKIAYARGTPAQIAEIRREAGATDSASGREAPLASPAPARQAESAPAAKADAAPAAKVSPVPAPKVETPPTPAQKVEAPAAPAPKAEAPPAPAPKAETTPKADPAPVPAPTPKADATPAPRADAPTTAKGDTGAPGPSPTPDASAPSASAIPQPLPGERPPAASGLVKRADGTNAMAAAKPPPPSPTAAADADLWKQGDQRQCHQVKPTGWTTDRAQVGSGTKPAAPGTPVRQYEADILPPTGHPLAQKGLVFSFRIRPYYVHELKPAMMAAFANANAFNAMVKKPLASLNDEERDFRTTLDSADPVSPDDWQRTRAVAPEPGVLDGVGVVRLQLIQNGEWKPADAFAFRAREPNQKGLTTVSHPIARWTDGGAQRAQVVLDPNHQRGKLAGPIADRLVYEYGCWASNEMPASEFATLCSAFIERSTLAEAFPTQACVATANGIDFAPR